MYVPIPPTPLDPTSPKQSLTHDPPPPAHSQLFSGTQLGLVAGSYAARSSAQEADQTRLMNAYRSFRIDVLKNELRLLEQGNGNGQPVGTDGEALKGFWH